MNNYNYNVSEQGFTSSNPEPVGDDYSYNTFRPEEGPAPKPATHTSKKQMPESRNNRTSWISRAQQQLKRLMTEPEDEGKDI